LNGASERKIADLGKAGRQRITDKTTAPAGLPPAARDCSIRWAVGGADTMATLSLGVHLAWRAGRITDHEALIGRKLAWILAGGDLPHRTTVTEQYLLELEREAFFESLRRAQDARANWVYVADG
jgi:hypothetical protein